MQRGPWSIKGIDPRARERARQRAQRDGLTLGDYLNRLLLDEEDYGASFTDPIRTGEFGLDDINSVTQTLDSIARQMESHGADLSHNAPSYTHTQSAQFRQDPSPVHTPQPSAIPDFGNQAISELVERLTSTERTQSSLATRLDGAMNDIRANQAELANRVSDLGRKDNTRRTIEAMRGLEAALSRLARQVHENQEQADAESNHLRSQLEEGVNGVASHVEKLSDKIDSTLDDAVKRLDEAVAAADKSSQNASRNLNDRLSQVEQNLSATSNAYANASELASAAQATAQQSNIETRQRLKQFASHTDRKLDEALNASDAALDAAHRNKDLTDRLFNQIGETDKRVVEIASRADEKIEDAMKLADSAATRNKELADRLFGRMDETDARLNSAQQNVTSVFAKVSDFGIRMEAMERNSSSALETLQAAMDRINARLDKSDSEAAVSQETLSSIEASVDERIGSFQERINAITASVSRGLDESRSELEQKIDEAVRSARPEAIDQLEQQVEILQNQLADTENRQNEAVEIISSQFERLSQVLDDRLVALETRDPNEGVTALKEELTDITSNLDNRIDFIEQSGVDKLQTIAGEVEKLTQSLEERVAVSERRSAEAIEQVGEQVRLATERLQSKSDDLMGDITRRLEDAQTAHDERMTAAVEIVNQRIQDMELDASDALSPLQNTLSSLAQRVEAIEDTGADTPAPPFDVRSSANEDKEDKPPLIFDTLAEEDGLGDDVEIDVTESEDDIFAVDAATEVEAEADIEDDKPPFAELDEKEIAQAAISARREFANQLAENNIFNAVDDGLDEDDLPDLSPDDDPALFEFEADLPDLDSSKTEAADHFRSDQGLDDDPFGKVGSNSLDFLKEARQAALDRGDDNRQITSSMTIAPEEPKRNNRLPIMAASALAVAVAGGAGAMVIRGKQVNNDEAFASLPTDRGAVSQSAVALASADQSNEEDMLFDKDDADYTEEAVFGAVAENRVTPPEATAPDKPRRVSALEAFASQAKPETTTSTIPGAEAVLDTAVLERPVAPSTPTLESAAANGDPVALHDLAVKQLASGEKREAAETLQRAANMGLSFAQYRLAKLYERGEGVPRSVKESRNWTKLSASGGNVKAMHDLAVFYAEGEGGEQSYVNAVEWFTKAANYGLLDSQYNLGVLYEQGLGVSRNPIEAAFWYGIAGENGDPDAARRGRTVRDSLSPVEAKNIQNRIKYFAPTPSDPRANGSFGAKSWEQTATTSQISEAQRLLNQMNYAAGPADGMMGSRTRAAISRFESERGMPVTGQVSEELLNALRSGA